jgi:hypothetical protein
MEGSTFEDKRAQRRKKIFLFYISRVNNNNKHVE